MHFETLKFGEPESGIGLITLNRPARLNALSLDMVSDLRKIFGLLRDREEVRVLIITGEGKGFCSGADLKNSLMRKTEQGWDTAAEHLYTVQKKYSEMILEMKRLPQPIVAAVNGVAAGGGMCLAMVSDVALASRQATFIPSFANIGLTGGDLGSSFFLPRIVGLHRAFEILLTGRTVTAEEAERIGLVSKVVEEGETLEAAMETARMMLSKNPVALRLTKEVVYQNMSAPSLEAALELENRNQSICCLTPHFLEAVERFNKEKNL
ncbi:MAG: enoyl-CoA hydratase/isomerase family protein [Desulfatiglans sp.]|jgi:enoyl-CoA hydratase|nr:enoyl-CoA hydratase/isomerase family protein [Desulfatiglans sp.]